MKIETADDGQRGLEMIYENEYDLIMLDVMLPGIDGFSLCREIRSKSIVPVLFITARGREEDILYGYELGCDDYIVKPFRIAELMAKSNALIKRSKGMIHSEKLICGKIEIDPVRFTVKSDGTNIALAPKEYSLLKYLMDNKGIVISREQLLTHIWGYDYVTSAYSEESVTSGKRISAYIKEMYPTATDKQIKKIVGKTV